MVEDGRVSFAATRIFPKTHDFQEWARRAGSQPGGIQRLNRFFIEAPAKVQDYFQIETFAGEVESYTDQKLLIFAQRPEKKNRRTPASPFSGLGNKRAGMPSGIPAFFTADRASAGRSPGLT